MKMTYNYPPGTIRAEVMPVVRKFARYLSNGSDKTKIVVMAEDQKKATEAINAIRVACFRGYKNSGDVFEDHSKPYEKKYNNRRQS